jgi:hypothetical protein
MQDPLATQHTLVQRCCNHSQRYTQAARTHKPQAVCSRKQGTKTYHVDVDDLARPAHREGVCSEDTTAAQHEPRAEHRSARWNHVRVEARHEAGNDV